MMVVGCRPHVLGVAKLELWRPRFVVGIDNDDRLRLCRGEGDGACVGCGPFRLKAQCVGCVILPREQDARRFEELADLREDIGHDPGHGLPGRARASSGHAIEERFERATSFREQQSSIQRPQREDDLASVRAIRHGVRRDLDVNPMTVGMRETDLYRKVKAILTSGLVQRARRVAQVLRPRRKRSSTPADGYSQEPSPNSPTTTHTPSERSGLVPTAPCTSEHEAQDHQISAPIPASCV